MHPVLQGLFDTMLEERLKNIECAPSYELYDIDGDIGALMDAVNYYYSDVVVKPIEKLVERYSKEEKTMGQLRAEIVNRIEKLKVPEMDVINKIPINYKENRSLKISFNAIPLWLCNPNGLRKPFKFCTFSCAISQNVLYFFKKTFLRKLSTVSDLVFLKKNSEMNTTKNSSFLSLQTKCLLFFFPHSIML